MLLGGSGGVAASFAQLLDLGGELVSLGLEGLETGDGLAASAVDGGEVGQRGAAASSLREQ